MTVIAWWTVRDDVADILRRAEAGERFTVTVSGRPVAELGPVRRDGPQRFLPGEVICERLNRLPPDRALRDEIRDALDFEPHDPHG